jgi:O-antigen/teichoic acid export membrane protein
MEYVNAVFQSQCLFRRYELYLFLRNTLFLAAVIFLILLKRDLLNPTVLILLAVLINLGLALSAYPYVSSRWRGKIGEFSEFRSNLIRYSKWLTVAAICFALYRRMDVYFLSHFRTLHEVGIYSVAVVLVEPVAMVSPALVTVFLPRISAEPTPQKLRSYSRLVVVICALVLAGIGVYAGVLRLVFPLLGAEYREAFPVAAILLAGTVLLIGYNMLSLVFLASDRPELFGRIALAMAVFSLIANWFAVPAYGVFGAAGVYGMCQALGIFVAAIAIRKLLREGSLLSLRSEPLVPSESLLT